MELVDVVVVDVAVVEEVVRDVDVPVTEVDELVLEVVVLLVLQVVVVDAVRLVAVSVTLECGGCFCNCRGSGCIRRRCGRACVVKGVVEEAATCCCHGCGGYAHCCRRCERGSC